MNLYEITATQLALIDKLVELEGELTPELEIELTLTKEQLEAKGVGYACIIKQLEYDVDIVDAEIKRLQSIKNSRVNAAERLKTSLATALQVFGIEIKTATMKISLRKSESVECLDTNSLPSEYKTIKVTETPDKKAIKESLIAGIKIEGCSIVTKQNLQIK